VDIEKLTKTQIILLTLLVSFVTSIATGIVTVTLMDQAPPAITQTINRVVERTVERVVPDKTQSASVITQEVVTVVKESDLIADSVEKNAARMVRIIKQGATGDAETGTFIGFGVVVSPEGLIATDRSIVSSDGTYTVVFADGVSYATALLKTDSASSISFLQVKLPEADAGKKFTPITHADLGKVKIGQTVLSLGGKTHTTVATGIISSLHLEQGTSTGATTDMARKIATIETDIPDAGVQYGSPLMNIFGEIVGMYTLTSGKNAVTGAVYSPADMIFPPVERAATTTETMSRQ
jgi:hypothetical protein